MDDRKIKTMAMDASRHSYAPYSNFHVGAAIETNKGLFSGCNIENASLGLTICAERIAIFNAIVGGADRFKKLAIYNKNRVPLPCGACLQVLSEFAHSDFEIIAFTNKKTAKSKLIDLLPEHFTL